MLLASVCMNFLSVRVPYQQWYSVLATPAETAQLVPDPQHVNLDFDLRSGPINGDIILLRRGLAQMGPRWWRKGDRSDVGYLLLLGSACCFALLAARVRSRGDPLMMISSRVPEDE